MYARWLVKNRVSIKQLDYELEISIRPRQLSRIEIESE